MVTQPKSAHHTAELPQNEPVLSLYFDTDPSSGIWRDKAERLRAVLDACEESVLDKKERVLFKAARLWAEEYIGGHHVHGKGIALFYAPAAGVFTTEEFNEPVKNLAHFQKGPYVEPLAKLANSYPRFAVVLVDNEHGRVIIAEMGQIVTSQDVKDYVVGRVKQTEANPRIERHHAVEVQRHLKHVAQMLEAMKNEHGFEFMVLGGAVEALPKFVKEMPADLAKLIKTKFTSPMYASDVDLFKAATKALEKKQPASGANPVIRQV